MTAPTATLPAGLQMMSLAGKRILVTGSARGLGLAIARGLAEAGAEVIVNSTTAAGAEAAAEGLRAAGLAAHARAFDVTQPPAELEREVDALEREIGPIDVLVNNAGVQRREGFLEFLPESYAAVIAANQTAVFFLSQAVARRMKERGGGKIVHVGSVMGHVARANSSAYIASKGAITMLTRAMCVELAPHNIQVNAICPGYFLTDLTEALAKDEAVSSWLVKRTPLGRWGNAEELVGAAVFLSSAASSYLSHMYSDGHVARALLRPPYKDLCTLTMAEAPDRADPRSAAAAPPAVIVRGRYDGLCGTPEGLASRKHFETFTLRDGRTCEVTVEAYSRSAAGKEIEEGRMRSPRALEKCMHFLVEHYLRAPGPAVRDLPPAQLWEFLWDRLRGARTQWSAQTPNAITTVLAPGPSASGAEYAYTDSAGRRVPEGVLAAENHARLAWLEFTAAALLVGGAQLCDTADGGRHFITHSKRLYFESVKQCFSDLVQPYRAALRQRAARHAEFLAVMFLVHALQLDLKVEDRGTFFPTVPLRLGDGDTTVRQPEPPHAAAALQAVYGELHLHPPLLRAPPVASVLRLLECAANGRYFSFFAQCRRLAARGRLSVLLRATLLQSFTYMRLRAVLQLLTPTYSAYTKLRVRRHATYPVELLARQLLFRGADDCRAFLRTLGVGDLLADGGATLRLCDADSAPLVTIQELCAREGSCFHNRPMPELYHPADRAFLDCGPPGSPLMHLLEPYCPPYTDACAAVPLCDCPQELFESINAHRAALLAEAHANRYGPGAADRAEEWVRRHLHGPAGDDDGDAWGEELAELSSDPDEGDGWEEVEAAAAAAAEGSLPPSQQEEVGAGEGQDSAQSPAAASAAAAVAEIFARHGALYRAALAEEETHARQALEAQQDTQLAALTGLYEKMRATAAAAQRTRPASTPTAEASSEVPSDGAASPAAPVVEEPTSGSDGGGEGREAADDHTSAGPAAANALLLSNARAPAVSPLTPSLSPAPTAAAPVVESPLTPPGPRHPLPSFGAAAEDAAPVPAVRLSDLPRFQPRRGPPSPTPAAAQAPPSPPPSSPESSSPDAASEGGAATPPDTAPDRAPPPPSPPPALSAPSSIPSSPSPSPAGSARRPSPPPELDFGAAAPSAWQPGKRQRSFSASPPAAEDVSERQATFLRDAVAPLFHALLGAALDAANRGRLRRSPTGCAYADLLQLLDQHALARGGGGGRQPRGEARAAAFALCRGFALARFPTPSPVAVSVAPPPAAPGLLDRARQAVLGAAWRAETSIPFVAAPLRARARLELSDCAAGIPHASIGGGCAAEVAASLVVVGRGGAFAPRTLQRRVLDWLAGPDTAADLAAAAADGDTVQEVGAVVAGVRTLLVSGRRVALPVAPCVRLRCAGSVAALTADDSDAPLACRGGSVLVVCADGARGGLADVRAAAELAAQQYNRLRSPPDGPLSAEDARLLRFHVSGVLVVVPGGGDGPAEDDAQAEFWKAFDAVALPPPDPSEARRVGGVYRVALARDLLPPTLAVVREASSDDGCATALTSGLDALLRRQWELIRQQFE